MHQESAIAVVPVLIAWFDPFTLPLQLKLVLAVFAVAWIVVMESSSDQAQSPRFQAQRLGRNFGGLMRTSGRNDAPAHDGAIAYPSEPTNNQRPVSGGGETWNGYPAHTESKLRPRSKSPTPNRSAGPSWGMSSPTKRSGGGIGGGGGGGSGGGYGGGATGQPSLVGSGAYSTASPAAPRQRRPSSPISYGQHGGAAYCRRMSPRLNTSDYYADHGGAQSSGGSHHLPAGAAGLFNPSNYCFVNSGTQTRIGF
jgi:hypothetical protein